MHRISLRNLLLMAGLLALVSISSALANSGTCGSTVTTSAYMPQNGQLTAAAATPSPDQAVVLGWLQDQGDYTTLLRVIDAANFTSRMNTKASVTILAPTDEAFAKLPTGVVDTLLLPENRDLLTQVINYHLIPGAVTTTALGKKSSVMTLGGDMAKVTNVDGNLTIADGLVLERDNQVGTATVDSIDTVLFPPDVVNKLADKGYTLTAYAPADSATGVVLSSSEHRPIPGVYFADGTPRQYFGERETIVHFPTNIYYSEWTDSDGNLHRDRAGDMMTTTYAETTPFGDSGIYGNAGSEVDEARYWNSDLLADATVCSPTMEVVAPYGSQHGNGLQSYAVASDEGAMSNNDSTTCTAQGELRTAMRKLWTDHVLWTRDYIIAAVDDKPDAAQAADRLMQNQEDIGSAIGSYYGPAAGTKLTALLKEHIGIAVKLIAAAKNQDTTEFAAQNKLWQDNGQAIAVFLSNANPNWALANTSEMMQEHLTTTTAEVQARLNKDYSADVAAFDAVYNHILMMSDALADGIYLQYPQQVLAAYPSSTAAGVVMGDSRHKSGYDNDVYYENNNDRSYRGNCNCR